MDVLIVLIVKLSSSLLSHPFSSTIRFFISTDVLLPDAIMLILKLHQFVLIVLSAFLIAPGFVFGLH